MNILEFSSLVWIGSLSAGFLGALTGLGGGVVIVPFLTSIFGVDIRYAVGASLVSVIATCFNCHFCFCQSPDDGTCSCFALLSLSIATTPT